jgi:hypothetical protein
VAALPGHPVRAGDDVHARRPRGAVRPGRAGEPAPGPGALRAGAARVHCGSPPAGSGHRLRGRTAAAHVLAGLPGPGGCEPGRALAADHAVRSPVAAHRRRHLAGAGRAAGLRRRPPGRRPTRAAPGASRG